MNASIAPPINRRQDLADYPSGGAVGQVEVLTGITSGANTFGWITPIDPSSAQTLTNKTINAANNTLTGVARTDTSTTQAFTGAVTANGINGGSSGLGVSSGWGWYAPGTAQSKFVQGGFVPLELQQSGILVGGYINFNSNSGPISNANFSAAGTAVNMATGSMSNSAGVVNGVFVNPTDATTGTGGVYGVVAKISGSGTGSGGKYTFVGQNSSGSNTFTVTPAGNLVASGSSNIGQVAFDGFGDLSAVLVDANSFRARSNNTLRFEGGNAIFGASNSNELATFTGLTVKMAATFQGGVQFASINTATTAGTFDGEVADDRSGGANSGHLWTWRTADLAWHRLDN